MKDTKPVLGIIGSIGAGKSLAAQLLARYRMRVIDGDRAGHAVLNQPQVIERLVNRWGTRILRTDGTPDRRIIAGIVFQNREEREALENIVFPGIQELIRTQMAAAQADPAVQAIVLDAAVMLEAGWENACDRILFIDAPLEVRQRRLAERSGWTPEDLMAREAAQMPLDEKRARSDAIVMNDRSPEELTTQLERVLSEWGLLPTPGCEHTCPL